MNFNFVNSKKWTNFMKILRISSIILSLSLLAFIVLNIDALSSVNFACKECTDAGGICYANS